MNIFITGAESTGKSTLTEQLARHFNVSYIEEYARRYVSGLDREYRIDDLEIIARKQLEQISKHSDEKLVFFDTGLIITYIWFQEKYNLIPEWLKVALPVFGKGKYLLCHTDISWHDDPIRENPHRRQELNRMYKTRIKDCGFDLELVDGQGEKRLKNAISFVDKWLKKE